MASEGAASPSTKLSQVAPAPTGGGGGEGGVAPEGSKVSVVDEEVADGMCFGRGPDAKTACRMLKALRATGCYFLLCILLGELENAQLDECGGFGNGWTCGGTEGCEDWKASTADG